MKDITARQIEIVSFIKGYIEKMGLPPTGVEMAEYFNWASPNSSFDHFTRLEEKGYLSNIAYGASRGYRPTIKANGIEPSIKLELI